MLAVGPSETSVYFESDAISHRSVLIGAAVRTFNLVKIFYSVPPGVWSNPQFPDTPLPPSSKSSIACSYSALSSNNLNRKSGPGDRHFLFGRFRIQISARALVIFIEVFFLWFSSFPPGKFRDSSLKATAVFFHVLLSSLSLISRSGYVI
jgi:hypothetical protein